MNTVRTLFSAASAKAWVAAVLAFLGPIVLMLQGHDQLTTRGIVTAIVVGIVAGLGTFSVQTVAGLRYAANRYAARSLPRKGHHQ